MLSFLRPLFSFGSVDSPSKRQEAAAAGCRVDNLIDSRERKIVLGTMLVQGRVVDTHPLDVCILLRDKHRVC